MWNLQSDPTLHVDTLVLYWWYWTVTVWALSVVILARESLKGWFVSHGMSSHIKKRKQKDVSTKIYWTAHIQGGEEDKRTALKLTDLRTSSVFTLKKKKLSVGIPDLFFLLGLGNLTSSLKARTVLAFAALPSEVVTLIQRRSSRGQL